MLPLANDDREWFPGQLRPLRRRVIAIAKHMMSSHGTSKLSSDRNIGPIQ
jgi:hypothetical protein